MVGKYVALLIPDLCAVYETEVYILTGPDNLIKHGKFIDNPSTCNIVFDI